MFPTKGKILVTDVINDKARFAYKDMQRLDMRMP